MPKYITLENMKQISHAQKEKFASKNELNNMGDDIGKLKPIIKKFII